MGKSKMPDPADSLAARDRPKGLLDFDASHEASDTATLEALPTDQTLGLPPFLLTASRETLLAYIAIFLGSVMPTPTSGAKRKTPGRPPEDMDIDERRAWVIWWYIRQQRELGASHVGSKTVAQLIEEVRGLPGGEELFRRNTPTLQRLISSVSKGKRKLGIDKAWHSETCAKFLPLIAIEDQG